MQNPIVKALKESFSLRVVEDNRWLVWNESLRLWQVYSRPYGAQKSRMLCATKILNTAVDFLLGKR